MRLKETAVRNAKPGAKTYRLFDGDGLYLEVLPTGGKYWRLKYRFGGREMRLALGVYPEVGLANARERRADARRALANGIDPGEAKKEAKRTATVNRENTFEAVAREWHGQRQHEWVAKSSKNILGRLERFVFPKLGHRPIGAIAASEVLAMLRVIESGGAFDLAQRTKQTCGQVFMYAIATGRAERNPVPDLRGALKTPVAKHHAYLKAADLPEYLQRLAAYDGAEETRLALRLLLLTFVRTMEVRAAEWSEIDLDKAEWRIPAERMKMRETHLVPLSVQAVAVLRELQGHTGNRGYLFPNHHKPNAFMSENTMLYALYRMGYHSRTTCHGFRSTASTILNENGFHADVIERQLAHCERNPVRAAYNHAQYLPERRKMIQWWADYLDGVAQGK